MTAFPEKAFEHPSIPAPTKTEKRLMRVLILLGAISFMVFVIWFFQEDHVGFRPLYYLLTAALVFRLIKVIHEWYHYWGISVPTPPESTREWSVDMLTTYVPGEPYAMTIKTLEAMVNVTYPHTTYLCDEGDDPYLKQVCEDLGVVHVTRIEKVNAKAGNINNALKQATGEITVILDPDHIPAPHFLDKVLPYFENEEIGYVQCVQGYYNQNDSLIAKGAAEQTYHFYGPMMMSMNSYGTAQAIGANCTFRREALDSIGGHAAGLSEDMHTAMQLHAKGWKSVYVPEALSRGLAPATLSSFYKQQLKWSRGTFELLFFTFPKLARKFTWQQIIHYSTIPLYFLYGLIGLIDISIPIASLLTAQVPWNMELSELVLFASPLIFFSMIIRQFAQRWLLEESERGFHLLGGILLAGTWWIFLLGFIYTFFRIKVPYIPTPKEGDSENATTLSIPNLVVILLSAFAIGYGLSIDYTPYSVLMATFGAFNILTLSALIIISQQKFVRDLRWKYNLKQPTDYLRGIWWNFRHYYLYPLFRQRTVWLLIAFLFAGGWFIVDRTSEPPEYASMKYPKNVRGFYVGSETDSGIQVLSASLTRQEVPEGNFRLVAVDHFDAFEKPELLDSILEADAIPVLDWSRVPDSDPASTLEQIIAGVYDPFLNAYAELLNQRDGTVFIKVDILSASGNTDDDKLNDLMIRAWEHIYQSLDPQTKRKIAWIWSLNPDRLDAPQPEHQFVDWYSLDLAGVEDTAACIKALAAVDSLMKHSSGFTYRPVLLSEVSRGLTAGFGDVRSMSWKILKANPRVRGWMLSQGAELEFPGESSFQEDLQPIAWEPEAMNLIQVSDELPPDFPPAMDFPFLKGVNYNLESEWRDGHAPLTRRQLERDFTLIREMGANAIRRYGPSIYDRNILQVSSEFDLHVLYGFSFDEDIDYRIDEEQSTKYRQIVRETVLKLKDKEAISAWVLGDDTWNQLSNHFSQPYLEVVREGYIAFLNTIAGDIHQIDPNRPVVASFTLDQESTVAFRSLQAANQIDIYGINVYDPRYLSSWYQLREDDSLAKPWIVTSFGPYSHANRATTGMTSSHQPIEPTPLQKSRQYLQEWQEFTSHPDPGFRGGLAFCWRDRMEGSLTWYGLTDVKGRQKASYRALKEVWTGQETETTNLSNLVILSPAEAIEPGGWHEFRAISPANNDLDVSIEWTLMPEGNLREVGKVFPMNGGKTGKIGFPDKPGLYRVYAYQTNGKGEVITASLPVQVGDKKEAPDESWWELFVSLLH